MSKKAKRQANAIASREELESVFGEYANLTISIDKMTAQMELEIAAVRQRYEEELGGLKLRGDGLFEDLHAYAVLHPEIFGDLRSVELLHGKMGFRTCPPKVTQAGGVKAEHTLAAIAAQNLASELIRVKRELDKDAVLARVAQARDKGPEALSAELARLGTVGLRVEQGELFYAEPKRENA